MTPVEQILEHARTSARRARHPGSDTWRHGSIHDVVLAHGRIFEPSPLPENVYPALPGYASKAAAILADQHAFTYVEGLALLPDLSAVIEHAWCSTFTGQVIDPNLQGQSAAAYLGVAFTMKFRRTTLARAGGTRPILISDPAGNPTPNLEILQHGLAPETILEIGKPYMPQAPNLGTGQAWPQWSAQAAPEGERSSAPAGARSQTRERLASAA